MLAISLLARDVHYWVVTNVLRFNKKKKFYCYIDIGVSLKISVSVRIYTLHPQLQYLVFNILRLLINTINKFMS